jgi:hypothetical protein
MDEIEEITASGVTLAFVFRASVAPPNTSFVTADSANFQAGFVVYPAGGEVMPHVHLPIERRVTGTAEFLMVRSGRCEVDIYSNDRQLIASRNLEQGDAVLSLAGGHGFRMSEDTVLLEIKQGPFGSAAEKERFERPTTGQASE